MVPELTVPLPQVVPVFEINPMALKVAQPAVPPALETVRLVVEAVPVERIVVVALVVVELPVIKRLPEMVEEALETSIPPVRVSKEVVAAPP